MSEQRLTIIERVAKSLWERWFEKRFTESDAERRARVQQALREDGRYFGIRRDV